MPGEPTPQRVAELGFVQHYRRASAALAACAPARREFEATGVRDVALVPADDLHLLPWGDLLRAWLSPALSQAVYPNAGAWWRCRQHAAAPGRASAPPRWGMVCARGRADAPQLHWVEVEQRLSQRLWHDGGARPDSLPAPDALLLMGYGELRKRGLNTLFPDTELRRTIA